MTPTTCNIIIAAVQPGSAAQALLEALNWPTAGVQILAVNTRQNLEDQLDWQFEVQGCDTVELWLKNIAGEEVIIELEKEPDEDPGFIFERPIFTPIKTCNNACPFCFIDQQPQGLRASLSVKDDDYRLSYFNNTYITLTNLTPHDVARIERLRPGPLYVSVHATTPEVRCQLLQNKKAGDILDKLRWLASLNIPFHAQIVLCPGINDGAVLDQTLSDLAALRPACLSVAVVPVGLTQYRDHLPQLQPVSAPIAQAVIQQVEAIQEPQWAYLSDEFYYKANLPLPQYERYGSFDVLDDGVGSSRLLSEQFWALSQHFPKALPQPQRFMLITAKLGAMVLSPLVARLNEIDNLFVDLCSIEHQFWGQAIDIAGLITGQDIIRQLRNEPLHNYTALILPGVMFKHDSDLLLDDMTLEALSQALGGVPIRVVRNATSAQEFLQQLAIL